jgi:DhnA family fructose-bisphosphate aldolase class Ia
LVQRIIKNDPSAVIIFASDHGLRKSNDPYNLHKNCQLAIRLPSRKRINLPEQTNLVNTFRIVLNQIAGQNIKLLDSTTQY